MTNERAETSLFGDISKFPHTAVEMKWKDRWVEDNLYQAHNDSGKPKYFVLDMYPYPSGTGLHVGHVEGYTATDIVSRYKRMNGFEVLHPMGWDAFGLPTENYAIQTGINPHKVTADNVTTFREQCVRTGFSIDWDREIDTSKAEYYKWTQSIFLDLYDKELAYKAEAPVNWCTGCNTALSNEQAQGGRCERCDSAVESKNIEQWFLKITDYADRLIADIAGVNWPESTKERQVNWIGRSEGRDIKFSLLGGGGDLTVFTTRPETLYGVSFIAVAPEYPSLEKLVTDDQKQMVMEYVSTITPETQLERQKAKREKAGVFTGRYVQNPLTGAKIPVWVADYVLMDYGTGVIMGVPAHDERDKDFAEAYNLESIPVIEEDENYPDDLGKGVFLIGKYQGQRVEDSVDQLFQDLGDKTVKTVRYKLRDWLVSRERYWGAPIPIIHCNECGDQPVPRDQLPVLLPEMEDFAPTGVPPLARSEEFLHTTCPNCNNNAEREAKTLDTFVDSAWYFMRFADPHNETALADKDLLKRWLPVDLYMGGADHATGHLLYARFITKVLHDLGRIDFDEPFITLKHQGMILGEDGRKMSKRWGNVVSPDVVSNADGSDALRIYEMFLGPLEQSKAWDPKAIIGSRRFIDRVWQIQHKVDHGEGSLEELVVTDSLVENVTQAIESGRFNIVISEFMKFVNYVNKSGKVSRQSYETFLKTLAPYAPFITEELWERVGNEYSIHQTSWPKPLKREGTTSQRNIPVTINGKLRGMVSLPEGLGDTENEIMALIKSDPRFADQLENLAVKKIIYKQGKVFNIVT